MIPSIVKFGRSRIKNLLQISALNKVKSIESNTSNLRAVSANEIRGIFADESLEADWHEANRQINSVIQVGHIGAGGVNKGDRRALYYLARHFRFESFLEVGTNIGTSTRSIAKALEKNGRLDANLTTVDILDVNDGADAVWKSVGLPMSPRESLRRLGLESIVNFVISDSISYLSSTDKKFDGVFLDGSHDAAIVYREIPLVLNALKPGGVVIMHDFLPPELVGIRFTKGGVGPSHAAIRLARENSKLEIVPVDTLPWPTRPRSNRVT